MRVTIAMWSNLFKNLLFIYRIQQDKISYRELIEFLHNETPPEDNNFLHYDYSVCIKKVARFESDQKGAVLFSVIIPTYNRCVLLSKTIDAIVTQKKVSLGEFELVILDNGSKDATENVVKNFAHRQPHPRVTYIELKNNYGGDVARNIGVLNSQGRFIVFTDDDCVVPPDWLSEFKRELDGDPEIAGVGGFKTPRSVGTRLDIYHRFLMWGHFIRPHARTKENSSLNRCGMLNANVCYRKEAFVKAGGFSIYFQHIASREFKTRLHKSGAILLYRPLMVEHFALFTFREHARKLFLQGWDRYLLYKLYPGVWPNPSFLYFAKQGVRAIQKVLVKRKKSLLFKGSLTDVVSFSLLSLVTNFCLWLGRYWVPAFCQLMPHVNNAKVHAEPAKKK